MPSLKKNTDGTPHIHEYVRVQDPAGKPIRYRCAHPDCTHVIAREILGGKRTICGKCHTTETRMDTENMQRAVPLCFKCSGTKKSRELQKKFDILEDLLSEADGPQRI